MPVMWVAQLQMEMLACAEPTSSCLLVSRSATKVGPLEAAVHKRGMPGHAEGGQCSVHGRGSVTVAEGHLGSRAVETPVGLCTAHPQAGPGRWLGRHGRTALQTMPVFWTRVQPILEHCGHPKEWGKRAFDDKAHRAL